MKIEAEDIASWIGSEAKDQNGDKVGKVTDVLFHGSTPVLVEVTRGLIGHKHHVASLTGATVTPDFVRLGPGALVQIDDRVTAEDLASLSEHDSTLAGVQADHLESLSARQERQAAAEAAAAKAADLEAEAERRVEAEQEADTAAQSASQQAADAHQARVDAEQAAHEARAEADAKRV